MSSVMFKEVLKDMDKGGKRINIIKYVDGTLSKTKERL